MTRYKYYPDTKIFRELYPNGELVEGKIRVEIFDPYLYKGVFTAPETGFYRVQALGSGYNLIEYGLAKGESLLLGTETHKITKVK